jgi:hypothetical protein
MKIFLTGGSGVLGQYLNIILSNEHEILTQYHTKTGNCSDYNSVKLSITDYENIEKLLIDFNQMLLFIQLRYLQQISH